MLLQYLEDHVFAVLRHYDRLALLDPTKQKAKVKFSDPLGFEIIFNCVFFYLCLCL